MRIAQGFGLEWPNLPMTRNTSAFGSFAGLLASSARTRLQRYFFLPGDKSLTVITLSPSFKTSVPESTNKYSDIFSSLYFFKTVFGPFLGNFCHQIVRIGAEGYPGRSFLQGP